MELYSGHIKEFTQETLQNQIVSKLKTAFFDYLGFNPSESEERSWRSSLWAINNIFTFAGFKDHGIFLEYQLPLSSKRLDCMICGRDEEGKDNAVIIELKQWEKCDISNSEKVVTWVGGGNREVLHPSVQVGQYKTYLKENHTVFYEANPISLNACSYLHNYIIKNNDPIISSQFNDTLEKFPLFSSNDVNNLSDYLKERLDLGNGMAVLKRVQKSKYGPSKKLLQQISKIIKENERYTLLDNQLVAFDKVMNLVRYGLKNKKKSMVIIKGGPGTGKSVIAINLLAELSKMGLNTLTLILMLSLM